MSQPFCAVRDDLEAEVGSIHNFRFISSPMTEPKPDRFSFLACPGGPFTFLKPRDIIAAYHAQTRRIVQVVVLPGLALAAIGAALLAAWTRGGAA